MNGSELRNAHALVRPRSERLAAISYRRDGVARAALCKRRLESSTSVRRDREPVRWQYPTRMTREIDSAARAASRTLRASADKHSPRGDDQRLGPRQGHARSSASASSTTLRSPWLADRKVRRPGRRTVGERRWRSTNPGLTISIGLFRKPTSFFSCSARAGSSNFLRSDD